MLTSYKNLVTWLTAHIKSDRGASMVEYALLVGLIAVVAIVGVSALGNRINTNFQNVSSRLGSG
jgi:pilus assembly protein Flp/PilA